MQKLPQRFIAVLLAADMAGDFQKGRDCPCARAVKRMFPGADLSMGVINLIIRLDKEKIMYRTVIEQGYTHDLYLSDGALAEGEDPETKIRAIEFVAV
jgi:hypothetical protein